jgi:hypothetical protein
VRRRLDSRVPVILSCAVAVLAACGPLPSGERVGATAAATEAHPGTPGDDLTSLIRQLEHPSFIRRDWALRRIVQQGAAAVPHLVNMAGETGGDGTRGAVTALMRMAGDHGTVPAAASAARKGLETVLHRTPPLPDELARTVRETLAAQSRRAAAQLTAAGAILFRDESLAVTSLECNSADFSDAHLHHVSHFPEIERLNLRGTSVSDAGMPPLAELHSLVYLTLSDTAVTGRGIRTLGALSQLRELIIYRVDIEPDDLRWLREHLPQCVATHSSPR